MLCISSVCITPSYRLQKTPLYNRLATFPLRLGSGNPSATSRETIPTMGPDSHVPSTPSVKDVTSCGGYHRITTVRLKSQADETQPSTPIGRTPEERESADTVCLFVRMSASQGPSRGPRVLPINGSPPEELLPSDFKTVMWHGEALESSKERSGASSFVSPSRVFWQIKTSSLFPITCLPPHS